MGIKQKDLTIQELNNIRHWIGKCIVIEQKYSYILKTLVEKGFKKEFIEREINLAQNSPYIKGANFVYKRDLKKLKDKIYAKKIKKNDQDFIQVNSKELNFLEEGDYMPYFIANGSNRILDIQSKAHTDFILILISKNVDYESVLKLVKTNTEEKIYFISEKEFKNISSPILFFEKSIRNLFTDNIDPKFISVYLTKNLKISSIEKSDCFESALEELLILEKQKTNKKESLNIPAPFLVIPNVISEEMCEELIKFASDNVDKSEKIDKNFKVRSHIHPNIELIKRLDKKLCKSLLPEVKKVFYSEITYREIYKICSYNSKEGGIFKAHRDTIDPYRHRKYGITIALNDDFQGGGLNFPEYNNESLNIKKGSAVVFPGSLFHQVFNINEGVRWAVISFLFTESESRINENKNNLFTFKQNNYDLNLKDITPLRNNN